MNIITRQAELAKFLEIKGNNFGCLADTGFLYAASYMDDRLYERAMETFDLLSDFDVPIYINVITRMEFIDLIFRKQITTGAIQTFKDLDPNSTHKNLFNLLKSIRDENTAQLRDGQSYKISEGRLKKLRELLEQAIGYNGWKNFCKQFAGELLINEWQVQEEELGLYFIEALEGQITDIISKPLHWFDMVKIIGEEGIRGPDAMISNVFIKSTLPLLITTDKDITYAFRNDDPEHSSKTVLLLN